MMMITTVDVHVVEVPLVEPVETAHGRFTRQRSVVVRLESADGLVGWGEIDPVPGFGPATADEIARAIAAGAQSLSRIDIRSPGFTRALDELRLGRAAVEVAAIDLEARASGRPVSALLGDRVRSEFPLIGWIGWEPPERAAMMAIRWVEQGFAGLKVKIGSGARSDEARIRAVRSAVGDGLPIRVDAGEAYDPDTAIAVIGTLERHGIEACEQPVHRDDLAGLARVRGRTGVPIILDESVRTVDELHAAISAGAVDIVKLKLVKHDGLRSALALAQAAANAGVKVTVGHGFALTLSALAEAHLASVLPHLVLPAEMVGPLKMRDDVATPRLALGSGRLTLGTEPGLGAVGDEQLMQRFRGPGEDPGRAG